MRHVVRMCLTDWSKSAPMKLNYPLADFEIPEMVATGDFDVYGFSDDGLWVLATRLGA